MLRFNGDRPNGGLAESYPLGLSLPQLPVFPVMGFGHSKTVRLVRDISLAIAP